MNSKKDFAMVDIICHVCETKCRVRAKEILKEVMLAHPRLFLLGGFAFSEKENDDCEELLLANFSTARSILAFCPGADTHEFRRRCMQVLCVYMNYERGALINNDETEEYYPSMYTTRSGRHDA